MYTCLIQKTCEFSALEAYQELEDFRQETVIKHGNGQFRIAPFADDFPIFQCPFRSGFFPAKFDFPRRLNSVRALCLDKHGNMLNAWHNGSSPRVGIDRGWISTTATTLVGDFTGRPKNFLMTPSLNMCFNHFSIAPNW